VAKGCILVVDDSDDMREVLSDVLRDEGYTPILACDGQVALRILREVLPDLIVTDWKMPNVDGITLLKQVAADELYKGVSFILMTGSNPHEARKVLQESGVNCELVSKPINLEDFIALIVAGVNRGHNRRAHLEVTTRGGP
jgi:CheY-like chemotaxis protein